jgi:hypothetical protein
MLLRFVISDRDLRTGQQTGLMTLAYRLLRSGDLSEADEDALGIHIKWLEANLPVPERFARKRNVSHKQTHGISWLKDDAIDAIQHLHAVADIARRYDYAVDVVLTERPGYVVHEDDWQVVAEPFHGEQS